MHEAGHCVAALAQRAQVVRVWVAGDHGLCRVRYRSPEPPFDYAARCLAGLAAECRFGRSPPTFNEPMTDMLDAVGAVGRDGLPLAWAEAEWLIETHGHAVTRIALALQRSGYLSGAEVQLIWAGA